ncbi:MAG TPA: SHOCT domain-containing protein [Gaiellaceae bacterium]
MRRRRPLARAAVVGGAAYHAGKRRQEAEQADYERDMRLEELEQQQARQAASPPAPPSGGTDDVVAQLEKLAELKRQGVLTAEEFAEEKRKLLAAS